VQSTVEKQSTIMKEIVVVAMQPRKNEEMLALEGSCKLSKVFINSQ
jgi:hypothetical protein